MRRFAPLVLLPLACACAAEGHGKVSREVNAVVEDEGQRAKVVDAVQKGATPAQAMDKVSDGPARQQPGPE